MNKLLSESLKDAYFSRKLKESMDQNLVHAIEDAVGGQSFVPMDAFINKDGSRVFKVKAMGQVHDVKVEWSESDTYVVNHLNRGVNVELELEPELDPMQESTFTKSMISANKGRAGKRVICEGVEDGIVLDDAGDLYVSKDESGLTIEYMEDGETTFITISPDAAKRLKNFI